MDDIDDIVVPNYVDLVREAFIEPLRSVTIIDDQYPTWEAWLDGQAVKSGDDDELIDPKGKKAWEKPSVVSKRIRQLREKSGALIVDIHNGETDQAGAEYYHHSDLVVLDYQLNGDNGGGDQSMSIATKLLTENAHFNLIVLHTQIDDLLTPFTDLLKRLLDRCPKPDQRVIDAGDDLVNKIGEGVSKDTFSDQQYFVARKLGPVRFRQALLAPDASQGHPIFGQLREIKKGNEWRPDQLFAFVAARMHAVENSFGEHFKGARASGLNWSSGDRYWIRTNRGFVVFSNKKNEEDLIESLVEGLNDWAPTPSRLISAKIRNLIEDRGVEFEEATLQQGHVGWLFYRQLIGNSADIETPIRAEMSRHLENYFDESVDEIVMFGGKIVKSDSAPDGSGNTQNCQKYGAGFHGNGRIHDAMDRHNSFVACKKATGAHLTPGHILVHEDKKWVVVTPACDLVPGRKDVDFLRVTMAELHFRGKPHGVREFATSGNFIFLPNSKGEIEAYSIYPNDEANKQAPKYETWIAANCGRFVQTDAGLILPVFQHVLEGKVPQLKEVEVSRYGLQLRYEYALNLLSKVGAHASRIGLDFLSPDKPVSEEEPENGAVEATKGKAQK